MTNEELLRPRYKVIADYPSMKAEGLSIGQILTCRNYDNDFSEKLWCEMNDAYPHLFQKLEWWEERGINDMPKYVKFKNKDEVVPFSLFEVNKDEDSVCEGDYFNGSYHIGLFKPATLTDYQNQSK